MDGGRWGEQQRRGDVANVVTWVGGEEAIRIGRIVIERENTVSEY